MPTYEYACTACDDRFDVVQSFSDAALTECGDCGGRLRKVFSPVGVVFKGSGFYKTDSRPASSEKKKPEPKQDAKPAAGSGDSSSSSAPAAAAS